MSETKDFPSYHDMRDLSSSIRSKIEDDERVWLSGNVLSLRFSWRRGCRPLSTLPLRCSWTQLRMENVTLMFSRYTLRA